MAARNCAVRVASTAQSWRIPTMGTRIRHAVPPRNPGGLQNIVRLLAKPSKMVITEDEVQWADYDGSDFYDKIDVPSEYVNKGKPPSSRNIIVMDPSEFPEVAVPSHFPQIALTMKGYDYAILDSYVEFIQRASTACGINVSGRIPLPTKIRKYTVLKSPHVHKTHRAQFETRTRRRLLHFYDVSGPTAEAFLDYIVRLVPPGVELKLKHESLEVPTGELAELLGTSDYCDVPTVLSGVRRKLDATEMAQMSAALLAYSHDSDAVQLRWALPEALISDTSPDGVKLVESLKLFLHSEEDWMAFKAATGLGVEERPAPNSAMCAANDPLRVDSVPQEVAAEATLQDTETAPQDSLATSEGSTNTDTAPVDSLTPSEGITHVTTMANGDDSNSSGSEEDSENEQATAHADIATPDSSSEEFNKLKISELKEQLKDLGLPTSGVKSVLVSRLEAASTDQK